MGSAQSNEEFVKAQMAVRKRNYLVLEELMDVKPPREHPFDLLHLGSIYAMDPKHTGRFDTASLSTFVNKYVTFVASERSVDSESKFRAFCTLLLWNDLTKPSGVDQFVSWIIALCSQNDLVLSDGLEPHDPSFVSWDSIRALHRLFGVRQALGSELGPFFELLKRAAKEQEQTTPGSSGSNPASACFVDDSSADQTNQQATATATATATAITTKTKSVPIGIVISFIKNFVSGFIEFFSDLGFVPGMPLDK